MAFDDVTSLTKFTDFETGLKILNSRSLRWSSPVLFADPFEPSHRVAALGHDSLLHAVSRRAIGLLFGRDEPSGRSNQLVAAIARWRNEDRFSSEEEATQVLKQLLSPMISKNQDEINNYIGDWQRYVRGVRICCFCDKPGNLGAWRVYGDKHHGLAFKFRTGHDTSLQQPKRVNYSAQRPQLIHMEDQVDVFFGYKNSAERGEFEDQLLHKSNLQKNEQEWRCFSQDDAIVDDDELLYSNRRFSTADLISVYLGTEISDQQRQLVIAALAKDYADTRLYQAQAGEGRYELQFARIATL